MSFQIEYTGSLVNNRDLPQITTNSSLTKTAFGPNVLPPEYEMNSGTPNDFGWLPPIDGFNFNNNLASAETRLSLLNFSATRSGTQQLDYTPRNESNGFRFFTIGSNIVPSGIIRLELRHDFNAINRGALIYANNGATILFNNNSGTTFGMQTFVYTFNSNGGAITWVTFSNNNESYTDYVRITTQTTAPVSITPSTLVNGANKTGGTAITPTITTVQDGSPSVTGPANKFGLVAADGVTPIASSQYYPPATDSEDSYASVTDTKTITASTNNISVEATGLDGEEKIERGSSVLVEDVTHLQENP